MKSTQEILERIREVAGLKRLEFGCEIHRKGVNKREFISGMFGHEFAITRIDENGAFLPTIIPMPPLSQEFEIIGLPVQLNDLFRVVNISSRVISLKINDFGMMTIVDTLKGNEKMLSEKYDLSLTVEQNLEQNETLREFISKLIFSSNEK